MRKLAWIFAGLMLLGGPAAAADNAASQPAPQPERIVVAQSANKVISFRPKVKGAPTRRSGGASRGPADTNTAALSVLATEDTGLTTAASPKLVWFVSEDVDATVEFVLIGAEAIDPNVQKVLPSPVKKGFHVIDLSQFGAELKVGEEYIWSVALVHDDAKRSLDVVSEGTIQRVEAPAGLGDVAGKPAADQAAAYAGEGIWYDAIAALDKAIADNPGDAGLKQSRADLLRQVGLEDAAKFGGG